MFADRHPDQNPPDRSAERRRLVPYFLVAILLHLALLAHSFRNESHPEAVPTGPMWLTLGDPVPAHPMAKASPAPVHPAPATKPSRKPEKTIALPNPKASAKIVPPPQGTPPEPAAKPTPQNSVATVLPLPATASTPPSQAAAPASNAGAATPALSPPRFDAAYLLNPKPEYPPMSRRLGEEGKVLLKVLVTAQGLPASIELEKSSGSERLDDAARRVVARWRFLPARRGDQPVDASVIVPISFRLEG